MASEVVNVIAEFSPGGDYLACSDSSGALQIWETSTGIKRQQYVPSSHLSATCCCIAWAPKRLAALSTSPSKKHRRSDVDKVVESLELIAVGTATGCILLYSYTNNALHTELVDGHTDRVTAVCWNEHGSSLYSCSTDGHIAEWSVVKSRCRHKWKSEEPAVYSVCLCHTQRHLLSAGRSIRLWDLDTREVLRVISGHQWPILSIHHVANHWRRRSDGADAVDMSLDGSYVISADTTDRHVSVWQLKSSGGRKSTIRKTVASLTLPNDPPRQVKISCLRHTKLQVAAVTVRGKLVVFQHVLNGPAGPLEPEHVVEIQTESQGGSQLPVRAISFSADDSILMAYSGDAFLQPAFEKLQSEKLKRKTCLIRAAPTPSSVSVEASLSKLKTPLISDDVTVLTPGSMAPNVPSADSAGRTRKRRRRLSVDITVEERLNAIGSVESSAVDVDNGGSLSAPRTDSLATLLTQGLLSSDKKMLNNVLQHRDAGIIEQTVHRLPLPAIVPLVNELSRRMGGHAQSALVTRLWLKNVMAVHASYLMTLPDRESILGPLQQVMETRLDVMKKVSKLQGRLNLIFAQLKSKEPSAESWRSEQPQLVYQDEDSSDEDTAAVRDADVLSEDEWVPQEDLDEQMESADDTDDESKSSEDEKDDRDKHSSSDRGRKSSETTMERDSDDDDDD